MLSRILEQVEHETIDPQARCRQEAIFAATHNRLSGNYHAAHAIGIRLQLHRARNEDALLLSASQSTSVRMLHRKNPFVTDDKLIRKIRKALAQADHPNTDPVEAELFRSSARRLMMRHSIDESIVQEARDRDANKHTIQKLSIDLRQDPFGKGWAIFIEQLSKVFKSRAIYRRSGRSEVMGFPANLEMIELLYESLRAQCEEGMEKKLEAEQPKNETPFRRAYIAAFHKESIKRVRSEYKEVAQEAQAEEDSSSVALVLKSQEQQVDAEYRSSYHFSSGNFSFFGNNAQGKANGSRGGKDADISVRRRIEK